ncbi:potassium channel family protein [Kitasatospora sp. NPDC059571]|uniref:potassium channel family protein n=1 Tax=Kitasatospora sp. NPDC059571 TaxID=3346871 RepID=UPI0036AFCCF5
MSGFPAPPAPPRPHEPWVLGVLAGGPLLMLVLWVVVPLGAFGPHHPVLSWTAFAVALLLLAAALIRQVLTELAGRPGRPALVIVLLSAASVVVFATAYQALARGGQFNGLQTKIDALYFTVTTLSTVGYGDVSPAGQEARVVVMLQIFYNLVFLTAGAAAVTRRLHSRAVARPDPADPGR